MGAQATRRWFCVVRLIITHMRSFILELSDEVTMFFENERELLQSYS